MSISSRILKHLPNKFKIHQLKKQELNIIENKIKELKSSSTFLEEFHKPKTNVIYFNDVLYQNNYSKEFLEHKIIKENFKSIQDMGRGIKYIDHNFLEIIKITEKEKVSKIDIILLYSALISSCLNIMNQKISQEAINKIFFHLKDFSQYDSLYISSKIDETIINFRTSNNFREIKNQLIEQIAKAKLTGQTHLVIKGYLNLAQVHMSTNQNLLSGAFSELGMKLYKKNNINDEHLIKKILIFKTPSLNEKKFLREIKHLDLDIKEIISSDYYTSYMKNLNENNPKTIYARWKTIEDLIEDINSKKNLQNPALIILMMHKWILTHKLGREAISNFYLEKAKSLMLSNPVLDENFHFRFYVLAISEASNLNLPSELIFGIFKNLVVPNKLCFDLILYRTFSLYYSVMKGDDKETVLSKYKELIKLHEVYFGDNENESLILLEMKLKEIDYV